jgi:hypothetical protein
MGDLEFSTIDAVFASLGTQDKWATLDQ